MPLPDIQPTFIASVSPSKEAESCPSDIPIATPASADRSSLSRDSAVSSTTGGTGGGEWPSPKQQGVAKAEGSGREEELRSSFSPHRTLTQTEPRGIGQAGLLESGSGSYSPHSSLTVPQGEMFQEVTQQVKGQGAEVEDETLVVRQPKAKKKKKKKKKSKMEESAESQSISDQVASQSSAVATPSGAVVVVTDPVTDIVTAAPVRVEADSSELAEGRKVDSSSPRAREKEGEGALVGSPSDQEMPWEHWAPEGRKVDASSARAREEEEEGALVGSPSDQDMSWEHLAPEGASVEGGAELPLGEYLEECDVGFSEKLHPLPLPQQGTSKRLSLADELEMAMEGPLDNGDMSRPHPGESREEQTVQVEATPLSDPTPSSIDAPPLPDPTPSSIGAALLPKPTPSDAEDRLPSDADEMTQESPQVDTPPSGTLSHPLIMPACDHTPDHTPHRSSSI